MKRRIKVMREENGRLKVERDGLGEVVDGLRRGI